MSMVAETAGSNCTYGGYKITSGLDGNGNGALDASEVGNTAYTCNGSPGATGATGPAGANGATGANGMSTQLSMVAEPAGSHCTNGGTKISSGLDSNGNGALDASEITSTAYVCNAASSGLAWVSTGTATAVQAVSNTGYIAANNSAQLVITLPTSPSVGDVVRVRGLGGGGWRIAQNAGQIINTDMPSLAGQGWTPRGAQWGAGVASSADGRKLVVAGYSAIYTSADAGVTWVTHTIGSVIGWTAVASSVDGSKLVATAYNAGIYTSTDSGATWTATSAPVAPAWRGVASSSDGSKLVAVAQGAPIYTSTDGGVNWTASASNLSLNWTSVASSADGSRLIATEYGGSIFLSPNSGGMWIGMGSAPTNNWMYVACSADCSRAVAVASPGQLYVSTDGGVTWGTHSASRNWQGAALSADGSTLVAAEYGGQIYTSVDGGETWAARDLGRSWRGVAISADGSHMVAVDAGGQTYTSSWWTTLGTGGFVAGGASSALELLYVGGGQFSVISHLGTSLQIQ